MAQAHEKGVGRMRMSFSITPSLSLISPTHRLFLDGHFETNPDYDFTDDPIHMILPYFSVLKAQDMRHSAPAWRSLATWPSQMQTHKADVIRAMHERVQLCQDPQTEFALLRESLGVSRINHILRVHGHTMLQERQVAELFDEVNQRSLERLFPGFTEDSLEQATLSAGQSGIAYKRARDVASPAHLGALTAARLRILDMIQDAATARLLPKQPFVARLAAIIEAATAAYLDALDGAEKPTAPLYLQNAPQAADESWQQTVQGHDATEPVALANAVCVIPGPPA